MLKNLATKLGIEQAVLLTIIVASLGYFVDVFDLLLFSIVRVQSLKDLGVPEADLLTTGIFLINSQLAGLLIGGVVWGVWGDRLGRVSVLFGSILLYSLANIANGLVNDVGQYAILRFIAGIGLAGELGAGVTLASELLPKKWRGLGTTFIAGIGLFGAIFAALVADFTDWRTAYVAGGVMGLVLLMLRMQVKESDLFEKMLTREEKVSRGNLLLFFKPALLKKYIAVILIGTPIWGVLALFITFTPEFAKDFGMADIPKVGMAVLFYYVGVIFGDMGSGLLSQRLQSRKKAVALFLFLTAASTALYVLAPHSSVPMYYGLCILLGFSNGYWAMFVQVAAEQFGTNIRATAATSIPNMVRGSAILSTMGFHALIPSMGVTAAGVSVLVVLLALALGALLTLKETFHTDLEYVEV